MPLVFRDYQVLVVSPGSLTTQVQPGIPESLLPALYEVPTRVYLRDGRYHVTGEDNEEVLPIRRGRIVDEGALHYFLKQVYKSATADASILPALLLVASQHWDRRQIERLCKYLFEEVGVPALSLVDQGLSVAYAYALPECLVIDVGYEKTDITCITEFEADRNASRAVPVGGQSVTEHLHKLLPHLSLQQCEDLKLSHIAETLSEEDKHRAPGDVPEGVIAEEEEGVVDVAAIVSSGRTREILENIEKHRNVGKGDANEGHLNKDLESNTFIDSNGQEITVGRERFEGTDELIAQIAERAGESVRRLKPRAQQQVWENVCITGKGASLHGFRSALMAQLASRYELSRPAAFDATAAGSGNASIVSGTPAPSEPPQGSNIAARSTPAETEFASQSPEVIRMAKISEHFPDWRTNGWETVGFLGAQIVAKQIFTAGLDGVFISRQDYNEMGPAAIWDMV